MRPTSKHRAFVDANVLASPVPRTILYLSQPLSDYELVFSPLVEQEAERHQKPGHIPVSSLRHRYDWQLVHDADDVNDLADTDPKDRAVLASAIGSGAQFLITANVRDFGERDLAQHQVVAIHPGLFLAHRIRPDTYREVLEAVGEKRHREPRDPLSIHEQEISVHLPDLFDRFTDLFGPAMADTTHRRPTVTFRGTGCARCLQPRPAGSPGVLCQSCGRARVPAL